MESPGARRANRLERKHISKIDLGGISTDTLDVSPDALADKTPVLIAPAWAIPLDAYKDGARVLVENGRRALSMTHPAERDHDLLTNAQRERVREFPAESIRKASELIAFIRAKGADAEHPVDVVGHSEGAMNTVIAALLEPDLFRNIILYAPPGFAGPDSRMRLARGYISQVIEPMPIIGARNLKSLEARAPLSADDKADIEQLARDGKIGPNLVPISYPAIPEVERSDDDKKAMGSYGLSYIRKMPAALKMSQTELLQHTQTLRRHGIGVGIISGVDDLVFPVADMARHLSGGKVDAFLAVRGKHGQLADSPEHAMFAAADILRKLATKSKDERRTALNQ